MAGEAGGQPRVSLFGSWVLDRFGSDEQVLARCTRRG